ncbi:hypothetical protein B0H11DRAFT_1904083 [Mycena galericulata]|nr:hypothetical protein B0H11DRAFT_1904083 [Mycena galericulata]
MGSPEFLPAWSSYTIPHRGQVVPLQQSLSEILAAEYALQDRQYRNQILDDIERQANIFGIKIDPPPSEFDSSDSEEDDKEYTLPGGQSDYNWGFSEHYLRPRPPRVLLADITPIPQSLTREEVDSLGFRVVQWDDPRVFADLEDRISAFFIGPPVQRTEWQGTIHQANNNMRVAHAHLDRSRIDDDTLRSGISYDHGLKRPRSIDRQHNLNNMVVLAALRYSPALQNITSFQNAMLKQVAPRLWEDARRVVDAVAGHDSELHLPLQLTNFGPHQPTAFSQIEYQFSMPESSVPHRHPGDHPAGMRAVTALGNYPPTEGALVLWRERVIVTFPPGSTFVYPAALCHISFTTVEKPSFQMLVSQSCSAGLHGYVANGFDDRYTRPESFTTRTAARVARAARAVAETRKYSSVGEFDATQDSYE